MKRLVTLLTLALLLVSGATAYAAATGGTPEAQNSEPTVYVRQDPALGSYLTDQKGMTLYLFTKDTEPGVSTCYDKCAANWPAFTAEEPLTLPKSVQGELTLISRTDGTKQVAYNGIPLYYWINDQKPGDTTGQGVGDVWFVVKPGQQFGEPSPMASPVASPEGTPAAAGAVDITLMEFAVQSSATTFKAGETYTFNISNIGGMTHELLIEPAGANDKPIKINGKEAEAEDIAAGSTSSFDVTFNEPGTYQLSCHVGQHYQNGMTLTIHVVG